MMLMAPACRISRPEAFPGGSYTKRQVTETTVTLLIEDAVEDPSSAVHSGWTVATRVCLDSQ